LIKEIKMNIDMFLLADDRGKKSVTFTAFVVGVVIMLFRMAFSDIAIPFTDGYILPHQDGVEAAAVIASLGATYWMRRNNKSEEPKS